MFGTVERGAHASDAQESSGQRLVRWTEHGNIFELQSSDATVMEMATRIFALRSREADGSTSRKWRVQRGRQKEKDEWTVSGESLTSSMIPATYSTRDRALLHIEQDVVDWLLHNARDSVAVHAALLSKGKNGIVIVGPSLAGKSTLSTALWRNGWTLMSDDLVFIDVANGLGAPVPRRVSLRSESRSLVGDQVWSDIRDTPSCTETSKGLSFHPHEVSGSQPAGTTPLSAIFFLSRREASAGSGELRRLDRAKAALSFLPYALNVRTLPFIEGIRRIGPLLESAPAFDLGRGALAEMVAAVETAIAE